MFRSLLTIDLQTCSCLEIKDDVLCWGWEVIVFVGGAEQQDVDCFYDELPLQQLLFYVFSSFISLDNPPQQDEDGFCIYEQHPFLAVLYWLDNGKAAVNAFTNAQMHLIQSAEHTVTNTFESKNYRTSSTKNLTSIFFSK